MSARTLYGYDRLALALHHGNVGIRTGSTRRPGGRTHLFDRETGRTACGRQRGAMSVTLVPETVTEENHHVRIVLCASCLQAARS